MCPLLVTCVVIANQLNDFCVAPAFSNRLIVKASEYKSRDEHGIFEKYDNSKNAGERRERLDAFAVYLKENQHFQAYIMSYGGRRSYLGEAKTRGKSAKRYLVKSKGVKPSRITVIDAGYREDWTIELWYGVTGGSGPVPLPTIDRKQVIIRSGDQ
jgi:hypothetical protein